MSQFYDVVLTYLVGGQKNVNRFTYLAETPFVNEKGSESIMRALGFDPFLSPGTFVAGALLSTIQLTQSFTVAYDELVVQAVYDDLDFTTASLVPIVGGLGQSVQSVFSALGFRTSRVRRDIRRGMKRFGGMPVSASAGDGVLDGAYVTGQVLPLQTALGATLICDDGGGSVNVVPVVLGREKYLVPNSNPSRYAYRYYQTENEQLQHYFVAGDWEYYNTLRSQTSRQFGHGN